MKAALVLELSSIAKGYAVLDDCLKSGKVHTIEASPISPGKFVIFLEGPLPEIEKSFQVGVTKAKDVLLDSCLLPNLNSEIVQALYGLSKIEAQKEGLVVVETTGLSAMLHGLHALASHKKIQLIEVRFGRGIGGKSTAFFTSPAPEMVECLELFTRSVKARGGFMDGQIIQNPHPDFLSYFNISGVN